MLLSFVCLDLKSINKLDIVKEYLTFKIKRYDKLIDIEKFCVQC